MGGSAADRRIAVLQQQLRASELEVLGDDAALTAQPTSAVNQVPGAEREYSAALPERLTPDGPWLVRRNVESLTRLVSTYDAPDDHIRTLYDNWQTSIQRYGDRPFLGEREIDAASGKRGAYKWITYSAAGELRSALGSGLLYHGIAPGSHVGLYSVNSPDWCLIDAACHAFSITTVPLYDTLGADSVAYICNHAELAAVACSIECLQTMVGCLEECPTVKLLVVYGLRPGQWLPAELPRDLRAKVITVDELRAAGDSHPRPHVPPSAEDLATICYTSGTTGVPKGVMLTHANLLANSAGYLHCLDFGPGDRYVSYLPLAHIYERVNLVTATHTGTGIGFYSGDVMTLLDDIQELKPTVFPSVPRLWNRIYDRIMSAVQQGSALSRKLFETAYAYKKAALARGDLSGGRLGPFWDKLVFSKVKARVGGEVRYLITGASPMAPEVFDFLRIAFGAVVLEGYGMTESACTIALTHPDDASSGHVGVPTRSCEVKLEDLPEMNYTNADKPSPRGEICVRGPIVFRGYFKSPEQTAEVLDQDGWLHTGDVGTWLPGGRLKIIDRKKNIFKLAQGEYVAPEKIENVYAACPLVAQSFVYGDSFRHQLVAIVVPDPEVLLPWAKGAGKPSSLAALCCDPQVVAEVMKQMQAEAKAAGLKGFEQVAAIHLVPEPFSIENGMLTPTFKLKRPQALATFQASLDALYAQLDRQQQQQRGK